MISHGIPVVPRVSELKVWGPRGLDGQNGVDPCTTHTGRLTECCMQPSLGRPGHVLVDKIFFPLKNVEGNRWRLAGHHLDNWAASD